MIETGPAPPSDGMIRVERLGKRYRRVRALHDLSFAVERGTVVGLLGRSGSGKTTTLRILAGHVRPTSGVATIDGRAYRQLPAPMRTVGFGLDAAAFHPAIAGRRALTLIATRAGLPGDRPAQVLDLVELGGAGDRAVGTYSRGMRQRLLLAVAMLGDPEAIVLDEPANGLDPQGLRWLRDFLRARAAEGRAVLLSSHVLGDVAATVDRVVVIARGRLVADAPIGRFADDGAVRLVSPDAASLVRALGRDGGQVETVGADTLRITGLAPARVGERAAAEHAVLHELSTERSSLEETFFALTDPEGRDLR